MTKTPLITMSDRELSRYDIMRELINGKINGSEAAKQLMLSIRQVKRLKAKVKVRGATGLIHGHRGRQSNRKIKEQIIAAAKKYLHKIYHDFKPTHASEKLMSNHQIRLSPEKVRLLMIEEKLWRVKSRKKNKEYRAWRPRKEYYGEMEQFDGSYHNWFEDRAPEYCLLAAIDDATGKITGLRFATDEGVVQVFGFWQDYVKRLGKPLNIYLDKYSTYKINTKHLLDDPKALTQFERTMRQDLNINIIHAHSCQAKGRIERLFKLLQDRLVKELRLKGISAIAAANEFVDKKFIPWFNDKYAVPAMKKKDLHRPLNQMEQKNLEQIFSIKEARVVNNDFTISYEKHWFQLAQQQPALVCRKDRIIVEKRLDGQIKISIRGKYLNYQELPERPQRVKTLKQVSALTTAKSNWKPPANHPWRKPFIYKGKEIKVIKIVDVEKLFAGEKDFLKDPV